MIWIVGNKGMLGSDLAEGLTAAGMPFVGSDREIDITDPDAIEGFAAGTHIQWIINCAAYTSVDQAEVEPDLARALNVGGAGNLARLASKYSANMIHISTDYVFPGIGLRPYSEEDPVEPTGVYGLTKAEGEKTVRERCEHSIVLRTAWLYGKQGRNFVTTMLRLMGERDEIGVVADQRGGPTSTKDLAAAIRVILCSPQLSFGTYHFTGAGETSWYEFALEIYRLGRENGLLEKECRVRPLTTAEYPTRARRPAYSALSTEKIVRDYHVAIPSWKSSLESFIKDLCRSKKIV